jgi:hypothetical protein
MNSERYTRDGPNTGKRNHTIKRGKDKHEWKTQKKITNHTIYTLETKIAKVVDPIRKKKENHWIPPAKLQNVNKPKIVYAVVATPIDWHFHLEWHPSQN